MGVPFSMELDEAERVALQQQRLQLQFQEARALEGGDMMISGLRRSSPIQQPQLSMAKVVKNPAHLHAKTLRVVAAREARLGTLCFQMDALTAGTAIAHRSVTLFVDEDGACDIELAEWSSKAVPFDKGMGQALSIPWVCGAEDKNKRYDFAQWEDGGVERHFVPGLVELRVEQASCENEPEVAGDDARTTVERTVFGLPSATSRTGQVEVLRQQFSHDNAVMLEVLDVFGSEIGPDGVSRQECTVCQTEPRNTMVLPCRHMCLCAGCSEYIRTRTQYRSYACPLCRKRISRMMRVDDETAKEAASRPTLQETGAT